MTEPELRNQFPLLLEGRFVITSPEDETYNCIAWSVNNTKQWWWPTPPGQRIPWSYWPPGIPHEETLHAFAAAYRSLGFQECSDSGFEDGFDKIAIYADERGMTTHAARWWIEDTGWTSKLGAANDILHHSLESLEGPDYGSVVLVMRRVRTK